MSGFSEHEQKIAEQIGEIAARAYDRGFAFCVQAVQEMVERFPELTAKEVLTILAESVERQQVKRT